MSLVCKAYDTEKVASEAGNVQSIVQDEGQVGCLDVEEAVLVQALIAVPQMHGPQRARISTKLVLCTSVIPRH